VRGFDGFIRHDLQDTVLYYRFLPAPMADRLGPAFSKRSFFDTKLYGSQCFGKARGAEPGGGAHIADAHMVDADIADVEAAWRCLHGDAEMSLVQLA
jgi:hypothetical protein